eukprot:6566468-Pyramimonas_sp.AAC.1
MGRGVAPPCAKKRLCTHGPRQSPFVVNGIILYRVIVTILIRTVRNRQWSRSHQDREEGLAPDHREVLLSFDA